MWVKYRFYGPEIEFYGHLKAAIIHVDDESLKASNSVDRGWGVKNCRPNTLMFSFLEQPLT